MRLNRLPHTFVIALAIASGACSSDPTPPPAGSGGSSGTSGSGGMTSTGGTTAGGTTSTGGATTGGTTSTGGTTTGGAGSGGVAGGAGQATGGDQSGGGQAGSGQGGSGGGGQSTGGAAGSAGAGGRGGAAGSGGGGKAGSAGSGGSGGGGSGEKSAGCGSASPLKSGTIMETIDGTARNYVIDVPTNYNANTPYRLIFVWHPLGGNASQVVNGGYNGLKTLANNSAIFVAPDGLMGSNGEASGNGWWNVNDRDMKFLTAMLTKLKAGLCIDESRIFSTGFSFGGMMSYTVGYEFDVFRAIAPCSGDLQVIPHDETFTDPLPIMAFHGNNDTFVTTARGRAARDKYLARNHCGTQTMAVMPSPCVQYQGCDVTTIWCEFSGGHNTWSEEPRAIWNFFSQY